MSLTTGPALFPAEWVPVEVRFPDAGKQRRWTIALRSLLSIPPAIVLVALELAAVPVVVVGWCAALALGRLPVGVAHFLANVVRYQTRVLAYGWLLLDGYPPFGFEKSYPVDVEFEPTRLGRVSVLFRWLLAIPVRIVATSLTVGFLAAAIPIWLIVLVLGRMPPALYQASAAAIRYEVRCTAYLLLLTSAYPRELFGDRDLVLSRAGKSIVALFLTLALAAYVGGTVLVHRAREASVANRVIAGYNQATAAAATFQAGAEKCRNQKDVLVCLETLTPALTAALDRFKRDLRATRFPADARPDARRLEAATSTATTTLKEMAAVRTPSAFFARSLSFAVAADEVDRRTRRLVFDLS